MGIRNETIGLVHLAAELLGGYEGLTMCELGNQQMRDAGNRSAKRYFQTLGVDHLSIDTNEKDGALAYDLGAELPSLGEFDIVTNYGTSEHIPDQYQVFRNIHELTRVGGMMVHCIPYFPDWPDHGLHGYSKDFLWRLAQANEYRVHEDKLIMRHLKVDHERLLVSGVLEKIKADFISREEFEQISGIHEYTRARTEKVQHHATA